MFPQLMSLYFLSSFPYWGFRFLTQSFEFWIREFSLGNQWLQLSCCIWWFYRGWYIRAAFLEMILSALLTSVGINLGLCFLFFALYSILRNQPGNIPVYSPRLFSERKTQEEDEFNLERLLPSPGWLKKAWQPSENELLSIAGLDAVVFMRIFIFW